MTTGLKIRVGDISDDDLKKIKLANISKAKAAFEAFPIPTKLWIAIKTKMPLDFIENNWAEISGQHPKRFKEPDFNKAYWLWVKIPYEQLQREVNKPAGSNRDTAFKAGYFGFRCKYQRNWILYPIYVAGKEWHKVNKGYERVAKKLTK